MTTLVALLAAGLLAHPSATAPTIPNCYAQEIAPKALVLACADGNFSIDGMRWRRWGAATATTSGLARQNDCDPYCAAGHFHAYPVVVTASRPRTCLGGRRQYTHLAWSFTASRPSGMAASTGVEPFPCSWGLHPGLSAQRAGGEIVLSGTAWTRNSACPRKVTLRTGGTKIAEVTLSGGDTFRFAWRSPPGRHVVVARQECRGGSLFEAAVVVG